MILNGGSGSGHGGASRGSSSSGRAGGSGLRKMRSSLKSRLHGSTADGSPSRCDHCLSFHLGVVKVCVCGGGVNGIQFSQFLKKLKEVSFSQIHNRSGFASVVLKAILGPGLALHNARLTVSLYFCSSGSSAQG